MRTSYKKSNTEEEFNKKRIKQDHSKKSPHIFIGLNNLPIMCS